MAENHKQMIPKHQEIDSEKHGVMSAFEIMMTPQANKPTKTRRKNRLRFSRGFVFITLTFLVPILELFAQEYCKNDR